MARVRAYTHVYRRVRMRCLPSEDAVSAAVTEADRLDDSTVMSIVTASVSLLKRDMAREWG